MQDNYTIMAAIMAELHLILSEIQAGYLTARDSGLDVETGPKFGTLAKDAESNWMHGENRKRMRANYQEDMAMTEIADINYDFQVQTKIYSNTCQVPSG